MSLISVMIDDIYAEVNSIHEQVNPRDVYEDNKGRIITMEDALIGAEQSRIANLELIKKLKQERFNENKSLKFHYKKIARAIFFSLWLFLPFLFYKKDFLFLMLLIFPVIFTLVGFMSFSDLFLSCFLLVFGSLLRRTFSIDRLKII